MSRRGAALFAAMCVIWGFPYLLIKVAVEHLDPWTLVLTRAGLAAAVLMPLAAWRGEVRPALRAWRWVLLFSLIEVTVPFLLLGYAEQQLSSSLAGLLLAAVPLVGALIIRFTGDDERLDARQGLGLLVGFTGVAALVGLDLGQVDLLSVAAVGLVAVCYAVGPVVLTRWLSHLPSLGVIALSLTLASAVYLPLGVARAPRSLPPAEAVLSVVGLAVVCTALAFLLFFRLIAEIGPVRATVITYVNPAVAVALGVLVLDEAFTLATAVGFVLILAGSVLSARRRRPAATGASIPAPRAVLEPAGVGRR